MLIQKKVASTESVEINLPYYSKSYTQFSRVNEDGTVLECCNMEGYCCITHDKTPTEKKLQGIVEAAPSNAKEFEVNLIQVIAKMDSYLNRDTLDLVEQTRNTFFKPAIA